MERGPKCRQRTSPTCGFVGWRSWEWETLGICSRLAKRWEETNSMEMKLLECKHATEMGWIELISEYLMELMEGGGICREREEKMRVLNPSWKLWNASKFEVSHFFFFWFVILSKLYPCWYDGCWKFPWKVLVASHFPFYILSRYKTCK